jgi:hypothetical protein
MSHISHVKTGILHPDRDLLAQVCTIVAGQHPGGRVADHYLSWRMVQQPTNSGLAIFATGMKRGIGLVIEASGELAFEGDAYGAWAIYEEVKAEIKQTYVSLATARAMQELHWTTQVEEEEGGVLVVIARDVEEEVNYA